MWLPEKGLKLSLLKWALAGSALLLLGGCFKPMYASLDSGAATGGAVSGSTTASVIDELAQIDIPPAQNRVGQRLRNELLFAFNGGGTGVGDTYRLTLNLQERTEGIIVRRNRESDSNIYSLRANFTLVDVTSGKVLHGGSGIARASYDRSDQIFANERAAIDAENRAARSLAEIIKTRVAAYFATRAN